MNYLKCPNCHEKIKPGERNCHSCGQLISKVDRSYHQHQAAIDIDKEVKKKVVLEDYKICSNCQTSNKINAVICRKCNSSLKDAVISKNDISVVEKMTEAYSKKEKLGKIIMIIYFALVFCFALIILVLDFNLATVGMFCISIFFIIPAIGLYFFPDFMFSLNLYHIMIENPEPTAFYYLQCKIGAVILPLMGFLFLIKALNA